MHLYIYYHPPKEKENHYTRKGSKLQWMLGSCYAEENEGFDKGKDQFMARAWENAPIATHSVPQHQGESCWQSISEEVVAILNLLHAKNNIKWEIFCILAS
jgi:23S rRNA maturation-related 3'-5' exoribonuclease YhaM